MWLLRAMGSPQRYKLYTYALLHPVARRRVVHGAPLLTAVRLRAGRRFNAALAGNDHARTLLEAAHRNLVAAHQAGRILALERLGHVPRRRFHLSFSCFLSSRGPSRPGPPSFTATITAG